MSHQAADLTLLPVEIWFAISWQTDAPGLAALARTCTVLKPTAEEVLYKKEIQLENSRGGEERDCTALLWAVIKKNQGTLDKLMTHGHNLSHDYLNNVLFVNGGIMFPWNEWATATGSINRVGLQDMAALHIATAFGSDDIIEQLLDAGADIEVTALVTGNSEGRIIRALAGSITPLGVAIECKRVSTALILLKRGASQVVIRDLQGRPVFTALSLAACFNLTPVVEELLKYPNADLDGHAHDPDLLPIHYALMCKPPAIESLQLLASDGSAVGSRLWGLRLGLEAGSTVLHLVAFVADETTMMKALEILRAAGSDIYGVTDSGRNLLHHAVYHGRPKLMKYLLEQGFDANGRVGMPNNNLIDSLARGLGGRATFWPMYRLDRPLECAKLLVEAGVTVRYEAVETVIRAAEYRVASFLLPKIGDPPEQDAYYWVNELHMLVIRHYRGAPGSPAPYATLDYEIAKLLTERHYELLRFLARHFPPPTDSDMPPSWRYIIFQLARYGDLGRLEEHINAAMLSGLRMGNGSDVLMKVLKKGEYSTESRAAMVHRLIEHAREPTITDANGNTYIHYLVGNKTLPAKPFKYVLGLLVKRGVDVNAPNKYGLVALQRLMDIWQVRPCNGDILRKTLPKIRILVAHGADRTVVESSCRSEEEARDMLRGA